MEFLELEQRLAGRLGGPLPGPAAHLLLSPRPRPGWKPGRLPNAARPGAALVLFFPGSDGPTLVLTVRAKHLPSHRGQVSFPGGAVETGETLAQAALREAREEVGVDPSRVRILGALTPLHIPASGYVLHPVVGAAGERPSLVAAPGEVARVIEVSYRDLADPERLRTEPRRLRDLDCTVPFFDVHGEKVWGATAMVLAELLWVMGSPPDPWRGIVAPIS